MAVDAGIQMKGKDLTKTFMMILNGKIYLVSMFCVKVFLRFSE